MTFDELYDRIKDGSLDRNGARKHFSLDWLQTAQNYIADVNRGARINIPEIIYGEYKNASQTIEIAEALLKHHPRVLVSRSPFNSELSGHFKGSRAIHESPLLMVIGDMPPARGSVLVVSAGAADQCYCI